MTYKCPLNFACRLWNRKTESGEGCVFFGNAVDFEFVETTRRVRCPIPVEVVLDKMVMVR
jgi:hypothetical protein